MSSPMHKCNNFQVCQNNCPFYLNEILEFAPHCRIDTRNNFAKLKHPFCKINTRQKTLSYIGPSLWNNLPKTIKNGNNWNSFKHNVYKKSLSKPVNWYHCHYDYLRLLFYYYYYYLQYYSTIISLTNPVPYPILNWGTTIKIRRVCLFCVIPAIFHF